MAILLSLSRVSSAQTINIYASPNADSGGTGQSLNSPVSLDRAKAIARANFHAPCNIWLMSGVYQGLRLDSEDTRSSAAPANYRSLIPGSVIFQPEVIIAIGNFHAIPDNIKARIINPAAKGKVKQLDLAPYDFPDMSRWPSLFSIGSLRSPKFYRNGYPLPMSRYPADTTMFMKKVITKGYWKSVPGGSFKYSNDRAKFWLRALQDDGVYLSGNWQFPWEMDVVKTLSINTLDSVIVQAVGLGNGLGSEDSPRLEPGREPYYALNLVEEINAEGQWSINFRTKTLYMWLPEDGEIGVSGNSGSPAISMTGVAYTNLIGVDIRGGSGNGIELHNCTKVTIAGSHFSYCSGNGISIIDGKDCTVQSNDIDSVGAGGVIISTATFPADQSNARSSGHQVINNHIYSYAREAFLYSAAVDITHATGTYIAFNRIHDSPHAGILFGGNNNVLAYNEVFDVVKVYTDMGAFYNFQGQDGWKSRGNLVNHNYIHDAPLANGIYLDNFSSGNTCTHNIIANLVMATFNHEGYFNSFDDNLLISNSNGITCSTEPVSGSSYDGHFAALGALWNGSEAYRNAYPECIDMIGSSGRNDRYTSRIWPMATGNVFISDYDDLSGIDSRKLFNKDGTTNAAYAQTGSPFTKCNIIFKNNLKIRNSFLNPVVPFRIDSLRSTPAFEGTSDLGWHINRIGLHKDIYRQDISLTKTAGIDPFLSLTLSGQDHFNDSAAITLRGTVKSPNARNILSSVRFMDNGKEIPGLTIVDSAISTDSAEYTAIWQNPSPGSHAISMIGYDSIYWEYSSDTVRFKTGLETPVLKTVTDPAFSCEIDLKWDYQEGTEVSSYEVLTSADSLGFTPLFDLSPKCGGSNNCIYSYPIAQTPEEISYFRLRVNFVDGSSILSNIACIKSSCDVGKLTFFPNPANTSTTVNYQTDWARNNINLAVYDLSGKQLLQKAINVPEGQTEFNLPVTNFANGIYLVVMRMPDSRIISQALVIQH